MHVCFHSLFVEECDDLLPVCYLYLDPVMILNIVFVGADDQVDCFKEPRVGGRRDTML